MQNKNTNLHKYLHQKYLHPSEHPSRDDLVEFDLVGGEVVAEIDAKTNTNHDCINFWEIYAVKTPVVPPICKK